MASNLVSAISPDNIKVSYANKQNILIENISISDANVYEKNNPGTTFLFLDGDNKYHYLNIDGVNNLKVSDLLSTSSICDTSPKPCGPPSLVFSGGGGTGAQANPVISPEGSLVAIDIVSPGIGYQTPPIVSVIDNCNIGSGAVVQATINDNGEISGAIITDPGTNYIPLQPRQEASDQLQVPGYPVLLGLKEVIVNNPGINYDPGVDVVEISPNNGTVLQGIFNSFGQVVGVKVVKSGLGFTSRPTITIRSNSGVNADFTPVFEIIRNPQLLDEQVLQSKIVSVVDIVGLTVNGYVDGKQYFGNVYFENGLKYAGPFKTFEKQVRVYDTLQESVLNSM